MRNATDESSAVEDDRCSADYRWLSFYWNHSFYFFEVTLFKWGEIAFSCDCFLFSYEVHFPPSHYWKAHSVLFPLYLPSEDERQQEPESKYYMKPEASWFNSVQEHRRFEVNNFCDMGSNEKLTTWNGILLPLQASDKVLGHILWLRLTFRGRTPNLCHWGRKGILQLSLLAEKTNMIVKHSLARSLNQIPPTAFHCITSKLLMYYSKIQDLNVFTASHFNINHTWPVSNFLSYSI